MKYAWIEHHRDEFSVIRMCARLEVSRSGYNQWRGRKPRRFNAVTHKNLQQKNQRSRSVALLMVVVAYRHISGRRVPYGSHMGLIWVPYGTRNVSSERAKITN